MLNRGLDKQELLRIVDSVANEKSIDKELILSSMESAIQKAAYSKFGFDNEMDAFALQFGHGIGLNLHERPIISRLVSMDSPNEIKEGMVFALETYCPAKDGYSAARIEEEMIVTDKGCQVITLFPAAEMPIANKY